MNIVMKIVSTTAACAMTCVMLGHAAPALAADGADVYAGYQFLHVSSGGEGDSVPLGFAAGVAIPLASGFSVVGDFGWGHKKEDSGVKVTPVSYGAGLRYVPTMSGMTSFHPYLQAVVGAEHTSASEGGYSTSFTKFMIQPGVGATFPVSNWSGFAEVDYRHVNTDLGENDFVFRAGIIIPVGKK